MQNKNLKGNVVLVKKYQNVLQISLNRPEKFNALNINMINDLLDIIVDAEKDDTINIILLLGNGKAFISGGDLNEIKLAITESHQFNSKNFEVFVQKAQKLIHLIYSMKKLVITRVHGYVAGYGLALVLVSDFVISSDSTIFSTSYSKVGLTPDGGLSDLLPKIVGIKKAKELLMTADEFSSEDALDMGIINKESPYENLDDTLKIILDKFLKRPLNTIYSIKNLVNSSDDKLFNDQLIREKDFFLESIKNDNALIGINSFINKTIPSFNNNL